MSVTLRKMTTEEFEYFYQWSIAHQAMELMEELHLSQEKATSAAIAEVKAILPAGLGTEHNHLMTVVAENEAVGFIWTIHEETNGRKQSFVCDFAIWESQRRKGYAAAALHSSEIYAAEAGCQECVLFVRNTNAAARSLYEKCGYRVLRQEGYGVYMAKQLS